MAKKNHSSKNPSVLAGLFMGIMALGLPPQALAAAPKTRPPIDAAAPATFETATFALG